MFSPKSILISSIRLIGDVILTTPLIDLLKKQYPDAAIDVLVASGTGKFLQQDPRVRNILTVNSKQVKANPSANSASITQLYRKYDIAITMNASDRGNLAVAFAGRSLRIGFYENNGRLKAGWRKLLLNRPLYYDTTSHVLMHVKQIAEVLGIKPSRLEVKLYWNADDEKIVTAALDMPAHNHGYFIINPFARWERKHWDMDEFVRFSDTIATRHGITPVWTSSPDPEELAQLTKYVKKCSVEPKTGVFTLNQMAFLIKNSALYIGVDTAITHIAASTGAPVIALYGPIQAFRWFPWNNEGPLDQLQNCPRGTHRNGNIILIQRECDHIHCIRPNCKTPCMNKITLNEVLAAAETLLQETNSKSKAATLIEQ